MFNFIFSSLSFHLEEACDRLCDAELLLGKTTTYNWMEDSYYYPRDYNTIHCPYILCILILSESIKHYYKHYCLKWYSASLNEQYIWYKQILFLQGFLRAFQSSGKDIHLGYILPLCWKITWICPSSFTLSLLFCALIFTERKRDWIMVGLAVFSVQMTGIWSTWRHYSGYATNTFVTVYTQAESFYYYYCFIIIIFQIFPFLGGRATVPPRSDCEGLDANM